jgi:hypothetical protein
LEETTVSCNVVRSAVIKWAGDDYAVGHRWTKRKADKNEILYQKLINPVEKAAEATDPFKGTQQHNTLTNYLITIHANYRS